MENNSIILLNAVMISRNIAGYPFPVALTKDASNSVFNELISGINSSGILKTHVLDLFEDILGSESKEYLEAVYGHSELSEIRNYNKDVRCGYLSNSDNSVYVGINNDEHLNVMCLDDDVSMEIDGAFDKAWAIEGSLAGHIDFAFDHRLGFLTSKISEIGTGLKVITIVSIPFLEKLGYMEKLGAAADDLGMKVEKVKKEVNGIFRILNVKTLGISEEDIISRQNSFIQELGKKEKLAMETFMISERLVLEDTIMRAYGKSRFSRLMSSVEAIECLQWMNCGIALDMISSLDAAILNKTINDLLFDSSIHDGAKISTLIREAVGENDGI